MIRKNALNQKRKLHPQKKQPNKTFLHRFELYWKYRNITQIILTHNNIKVRTVMMISTIKKNLSSSTISLNTRTKWRRWYNERLTCIRQTLMPIDLLSKVNPKLLNTSPLPNYRPSTIFVKCQSPVHDEEFIPQLQANPGKNMNLITLSINFQLKTKRSMLYLSTDFGGLPIDTSALTGAISEADSQKAQLLAPQTN